MRAALIRGGVVENVILVGEDFEPPEGTLLRPVGEEQPVSIGWTHLGGDAYEAPVLPEDEAASSVVADISRRQFFQALAKPPYRILTEEEAEAALDGVIPAPMGALINQLPPEIDRFDARMLVKGASTFNLWHPVSTMMAGAFGWDELARIAFWRFAGSL